MIFTLYFVYLYIRLNICIYLSVSTINEMNMLLGLVTKQLTNKKISVIQCRVQLYGVRIHRQNMLHVNAYINLYIIYSDTVPYIQGVIYKRFDWVFTIRFVAQCFSSLTRKNSRQNVRNALNCYVSWNFCGKDGVSVCIQHAHVHIINIIYVVICIYIRYICVYICIYTMKRVTYIEYLSSCIFL